jgi:hypothetical protein
MNIRMLCNAQAVVVGAGSMSYRSRSTGFSFSDWRHVMSKLLRGVAAGYGAKKLGGGCFSTVLIFLILWWALGHFHIFR